MLVNLKLGWLVVSNLLTMIRLAKTALKLPFDADTSLIALIHLILYTFKAGSLPTAKHENRQSTLAIEIQITS